jgi:cyclopropane fatty-acyl-phospholipid synthase-like methyltransferase
VGRLVIPLALYAEQAISIEISDSMIAELKKNLKRYKINNVKIYKTVDDLLLSDSVKMFDWINSHIVFQHIPPEKGYIILEQLLKGLKIGGYFSLHFNIFRIENVTNEAVYQQIDSSIQKVLYSESNEVQGQMQMYDSDLEYRIHIPSDITLTGSVLTIKFNVKYNKSPLQLGKSNDPRKLGLGISKMMIKTVK